MDTGRCATYGREESYSKELAARLDVEVPFRMGSKIDGYVKFGGKVRDMKRGYDKWQRGSNFGRHSGEYLGDTAIARLPDFGWQYTPNTEFGFIPFAEEPYAQDFSLLGAQSWFHTDFDKLEYVLEVCDDILNQKMLAIKMTIPTPSETMPLISWRESTLESSSPLCPGCGMKNMSTIPPPDGLYG